MLTVVGCGGHATASATSPTTAAAPSSSLSVTASSASVPTTSTVAPTTTTVAINTSVVPAVITVAYVNAVLAQLNHVYGNAVRLVVKTGTIPPAAVADLQAIYSGQQYQDELRIFSIQIVNGLQNIKSDPGDRVFTVERFIQVTQACISLVVSANYSALTSSPAAPAVAFVWMTRSSQADAKSLNNTEWDFSGEMSAQPKSRVCV